MILPQANLKAKDLDRNFFPRKELVEAYKAVGQEYERIGTDRLWEQWYALVAGNDKLKEQPIGQRIDNMIRHKDSKGEWLTFQMSLSGKDWKGNRKDFWYDQGGKIDGYPEFIKEIDPQTDQVIAGTTQINEVKTIYNIPFSREKVIELEPFLSETCGFSVKDRSGGIRRSCSFEEFRDLSYEELINAVTAYIHTDYYKLKQMVEASRAAIAGGGVKG